MFIRAIALVALTACLSAIMVKCDQTYHLEFGKSATLDCSSLQGKVDFYERDLSSSKTKSEDEFHLIKSSNITAENRNPRRSLRIVNEEKKTLEFSSLTKDDIDLTYLCKNDKNENKTFDLHPQLIPNPQLKSNFSILSSSFRLVLSLQVKRANCTWHLKRADQNSSELKIEENNKYKVLTYQTDNTTDVWINDLHINMPDNQDSGVYVCMLKNGHGETNRMFDVKVKDELWALWPFLVVLAQVLLCSALFFIWEKRCSGRDNSNEYSFDKSRGNPRA